MVDPDTGELRSVQLGSPRRLRTISRPTDQSAHVVCLRPVATNPARQGGAPVPPVRFDPRLTYPTPAPRLARHRPSGRSRLLGHPLPAQRLGVQLYRSAALRRRPGHKDVVATDYDKAQRILTDGEVFRSSELAAVGFFEEGGKLWMVSLKTSINGRETYLTSLRRARGRERSRWRLGGPPTIPRATVAPA